MDTGMKFNVVYGRNLVAELKDTVRWPYLVITMEDMWPKFKDKFDENMAAVYFVHTLEFDTVCAEIDALPKFNAVIGLGGGQALDVAKLTHWRHNIPLVSVPTSMGTNAAFTHRAGMRFGGVVRYRGFCVPQVAYVDYDVIKECPPHLNIAGIGDAICYHTGLYDWKYAHDMGKGEFQWPWDPEMAANSQRIFQGVIDHVDDIHDLNDAGIKALMGAHNEGGPIFGNYGWNARYIEGVEHFIAYTLEYITGKKFIHGQIVAMGVYIGSEMQNNKPDWILGMIKRFGVDIRPEAMNLSWDEIRAGLKDLKNHIKRGNLWYTVGNDFEPTEEFCDMIQKKITDAYGPWTGEPYKG